MPKDKDFSSSASEPPVKGLKYSSDLEEWKRINAQDPEKRKEISTWMKTNHKKSADLYFLHQASEFEKRQSEARQIDLDDAIKIINDAIPMNVGRGWFVNADSDYKPALYNYVMNTPGLLNAGWNIAYDHYKWLMRWEKKTPLSFKKWLVTPQTYYRGDRGDKHLVDNDRFVAYTPDRASAQKFAGNYEDSKISTIKIKPIDTLGGYQTTGEMEYWVPRWKLK